MKARMITVLLLSSLIVHGEDSRYQNTWLRKWSFPWDVDSSLAFRGAWFGQGHHRSFQENPQGGAVITSRLEKGGAIWEVVTSDGHYTDVRKASNDPSENAEIYFTITGSYFQEPGQMLVDVFETNTEASFLTADRHHYYCFQLKKKPVPQPAQAGQFIMSPHAANSANWYVSRVISLLNFGYELPSSDREGIIQSVKLTAINTVEVIPTQNNASTDVLDLSSGQPMKNGVSVLTDAPLPDEPCAPWTEARIIAYYLQRLEKPSELTRRLEGGRTRVFQVLDQIQDQQSAALIKQKIDDSITAGD